MGPTTKDVFQELGRRNFTYLWLAVHITYQGFLLRDPHVEPYDPCVRPDLGSSEGPSTTYRFLSVLLLTSLLYMKS